MVDTSHDEGITLVEVLVTISLMSIMMAIAVSGWSAWGRASEHSGTARELQSVMRQAQQRAVTEGRATCVWFDTTANSYSIYRGRCSESSKTLVTGPVPTGHDSIRITDPSFTSAAGTPMAGVTFQGRGTGSPGTVKILRDGSSKVYTIKVEGLTGRVSLG